MKYFSTTITTGGVVGFMLKLLSNQRVTSGNWLGEVTPKINPARLWIKFFPYNSTFMHFDYKRNGG